MVEDRLISSFTNFARTGFESILRPDLILVFEKIDQKIIRLNYSKSIFFLLLDIYIYIHTYTLHGQIIPFSSDLQISAQHEKLNCLSSKRPRFVTTV